MKSDTRRCGHFGKNVVIVKTDFVIRRLGRLIRMRKGGAETGRRICFRARLELQFADGRHDQEIAEIRMSCSAEMRVRESDDRAVVILIPGAVFVRLLVVLPADVVRLLVGVGRKLHRPEGHRRARVRVTHLLRADKWVNVADEVLRSLTGD